MTFNLLLTQLLNGVQFGVLLFLMAAGLTLVFGIMGFINLAHGSLYMLGAYFAAVIFAKSGSFWVAVAVASLGVFVVGALVDKLGLSVLHKRDHLDQVLATFGIVIFCNELVRFIWGSDPLYMDAPAALSGPLEFFGLSYPAYRFAIIGTGLVVALALYFLIERTRIGMLIRAGASNRSMVAALGVNITRLNLFIFALGAGLAGWSDGRADHVRAIRYGRRYLDPHPSRHRYWRCWLDSRCVSRRLGGRGDGYLGACFFAGAAEKHRRCFCCQCGRASLGLGVCLSADGHRAGFQARWPVSGS
jgi:branched-chain amino acid transport system permease protein